MGVYHDESDDDNEAEKDVEKTILQLLGDFEKLQKQSKERRKHEKMKTAPETEGRTSRRSQRSKLDVNALERKVGSLIEIAPKSARLR